METSHQCFREEEDQKNADPRFALLLAICDPVLSKASFKLRQPEAEPSFRRGELTLRQEASLPNKLHFFFFEGLREHGLGKRNATYQ